MQALRQAQAEHAEALERVDRQLAAIEELVSKFPLTDPKVSISAGTGATSMQHHRVFHHAAAGHSCLLSSRAACLQDESMQDIMADLRGKYKAVCAKLGVPDRKLSLGTSIQLPAVPLDF